MRDDGGAGSGFRIEHDDRIHGSSRVARDIDVVASRLDERGVASRGVVGVVAGRSLDCVRAIVALLHSERTVVLFDAVGFSSGRAESVRRRIEDSPLDVLLSDDVVRDGGSKHPVLSLADVLVDEPGAVTARGSRPGRIPVEGNAYYIHTSGSTGAPKLVAVSRRSVRVAARDWVQAHGLDGRSRILQLAAMSFDVFLQDILRALTAQCSLVLAADDARIRPAMLADAIAQARATFLDTTPSILAGLAGIGEDMGPEEAARRRTALQSLRTIAVGGESLSASVLDATMALSPGLTVLNTYGLTETAIDNIGGRARDLAGDIVLGRPYPHCETALLHPTRDEIVEDEGELCIIGDYVASGYVRSDGTIDTGLFRIPALFADRPAFRTGDLVRRRGEGYAYVERLNGRVKIHGEQVSLPRVAEIVSRLPGIGTAVCLADPPAGLVMHVTGTAGDDVIRRAVRAAAGPLAVPRRIHRHAKLPLTANGKIDTMALAESFRPAEETPVLSDGLAALLSDLFGAVPARDDDVLADLGIDSLRAARLAVALERRNGAALAQRVTPLTSIAELRALSAGPALDRQPEPVSQGPIFASTAQTGVLLDEQTRDCAADYTVSTAFRIDGPVSKTDLAEAIEHVVDRHVMLRVRAAEEGDGWKFLPDEGARLAARLRVVAPADKECDALVARELTRRIDILHEGSFRSTLVDAGSHATLVLAGHHTAVDDHALGLIVDALCARRDSRPDTLPDTDHVRSLLRYTPSEHHVDYWRRRLASGPDISPAPSPRTSHVESATAALPHGLWKRVRSYASRERTTAFAVLLAAVAVCETRWEHSGACRLGYPRARRETAAAVDAVAFLVDTQFVDARVDGVSAVCEIVRSIARQLHEHSLGDPGAAAEALADVPGGARGVFRTWVNDLGPVRAPSTFGDAVVSELPGSETSGALFSRNIYVRHDDDDATMRVLVHDHDNGMAAIILDRVIETLTLLVDDPDRSAAALAAAARGMLIEGPRGSTDQSVSPLALLARRDPCDALLVGERTVSVAELLAAARAQRDPKGLRPIRLRRDVDSALILLAGLLGSEDILVPLDSDDPSPRNERILAACQELAGNAAAGGGYVLATSGTTGAPLPVLAPRAALFAAVGDIARRLACGPADRYLLLAGLSHDPLLRELLLPVLSGGVLVVPDAGIHRDPAALAAEIVRAEATVLFLTPPLAQLLVSTHMPSSRVRAIVLAGDRTSRALLARLREAFPVAEIYNGYGATQTPQLPLLRRVAPDEDEALLGDPAPGVDVVVRGRDGADNAPGEPGEIVLITRRVATRLGGGALGIRRTTGEVEYRTGDRAVLLPSGAMRFLGRMTRGASVDGVHVDPSEIEAALEHDARVLACRAEVLSPEGDGEDERIRIVLVVRAADDEYSESHVRRRLRAELPAAFMPHRIIVARDLPLTPNSKIDARRVIQEAAQPPVTRRPVARASVVRAAWESVLGRVDLDADDHFFDRGGTSMLLLAVQRRIQAASGWAPALIDLYQRPTLRGMEELCAQPAGVDVGRTPVAARSRSRADERRRRLEARTSASGGGRRDVG
ncbi:AMP-binding protein [Microbacterium sp. SLBN-146]|uniref:AMP-binding protein n=1 Tax=Microbacterium sp. SLBN-146 TaxID=2768457 RepID=UPI00116D1835|nr:AMP-binding protein [Microbacterium sp. SLBN-146]TQJ31127.1 acyl-CoA synthetase (AMP-forming)/AMP-acid ligase II [Microbacterium sp. SLBN-146]